MLNALSRTLTSLDVVHSEKGFVRHITSYLMTKDIDGFTLGVFANSPNRGNIVYNYVSPELRRWRDYYHREGFYGVDPWLMAAYQNCGPVYWKYDVRGKKDSEREYHSAALAYGICDGMDFPAHGPFGSYAHLSIYNIDKDGHKNVSSAYAQEIMFYFTFFAARFRLHYQPNLCTDIDITERERQCLKLTSENYKISAIAKKLGITVGTVNFHLQKAMKKLGVQNKYQAIILLGDFL